MTTRRGTGQRLGHTRALLAVVALVAGACATTEPSGPDPDARPAAAASTGASPRAAEETAAATRSPGDGAGDTPGTNRDTTGDDSGEDGPSTSTGGPSTDGGTTTSGASTGGGTTTGQPPPTESAPPPDDSTPGVNGSEVKIGFIVIDRTGADQSVGNLGGEIADQGDAEEQVHAIVDWLNARGGIAGKTIVPIIVRRNPNSSDPNHAESICRSLTEDHEVFAAMDSAGQSAPCYAEHHTVFLANSFLPKSLYDQTRPYLWSPSLPSLDAGYRAYVDGLAAQDYFPDPPGRLGVVVQDSATGRRMYEEVVAPELAERGVGEHSVEYVQGESNADLGFVAQQMQTVILQFQEDGVTHVIFMFPGGGIPLVFMQSAEQQQYRPRYGLSTYDQPGFVLQGSAPAEQMRDSLGVGWSLSLDVDPGKADPYPAGEGERQCLEALEAGDAAPASRANATFVHIVCDGAFMLHEAGKSVDGRLTTDAWTAAASALGTRFQGAFGLPDSTRFVPGRPYGGSRYRHFHYDDSCACYVYTAPTMYEIPYR